MNEEADTTTAASDVSVVEVEQNSVENGQDQGHDQLSSQQSAPAPTLSVSVYESVAADIHFNHILPFVVAEDFLNQVDEHAALKSRLVQYVSRHCPTICYGAAIETWIVGLCMQKCFAEIQKHSSFILSCQAIVPRAINALLRQMVVGPVPELEWCLENFPNREICARRNILEILLQGPHNEFTSHIFYNDLTQENAHSHQTELERYIELLIRFGARAGRGRNLISMVMSNLISIVNPRILQWLFRLHPVFDATYYSYIPLRLHDTIENAQALENTLDVIQMLIDRDDQQGYREHVIQYRHGGNSRCTVVSYLVSQFIILVEHTDSEFQQKNYSNIFAKFEGILLQLLRKDPELINHFDTTSSRGGTLLMTLITLPADYLNFKPFLHEVLQLTINCIDFNTREALTQQNIFHVIITQYIYNNLLYRVVEQAATNQQGQGQEHDLIHAALNTVTRRYSQGITPAFLIEFLDMIPDPQRVVELIPCIVTDIIAVRKDTVFNRIVSGEIVTVELFDRLCSYIFGDTTSTLSVVSRYFESDHEKFAAYMLRHFYIHMKSVKYLDVMLRHLYEYQPQFIAKLGTYKTEEGMPVWMFMYGQLNSQLEFVSADVLGLFQKYITLAANDDSNDEAVSLLATTIGKQQSKYFKQNMLHLLFMSTDLHELCDEYVAFVQSLLFEYKVDPNQQDRYGNTALHYLVQCGRPQVIHRQNNWCPYRISGNSSSPGARVDVDMCTNPQHWSMYPTLNSVVGDQTTATTSCPATYLKKLVHIMMEAGADPSIRNRHERSSFMLLAALGRYELFLEVLRLLYHAENSPADDELATQLVQHALQADRDGNTVLHWLCARAVRNVTTIHVTTFTMIQLLMKHHEQFGIDPFATNKHGHTCYTYMFSLVPAGVRDFRPYVLDILKLFGTRITRDGHIFYWLTYSMVSVTKQHYKYSVQSMNVIRSIFAHLLENMESPNTDFRSAIGVGKNTPLHLVLQQYPSQLDPFIQQFIVYGKANMDVKNNRGQTPRQLLRSLNIHMSFEDVDTGEDGGGMESTS